MMRRLLAAEAAFDPFVAPYRERADKIMVGMSIFLLLVCLALVPLRGTLFAVLSIGLPTTLLGAWLAQRHTGALVTRLFMASGFMVFTALIIHQTGGDIEAHFSAFGLIGVLLYYRDWRTIVTATVVVYLHHLLLGYAQWKGAPVYVFDNDRFWLTFAIHVLYFLPFVGMMAYLSVWLRREGYEDQHVIGLAQQIIRGDLTDDATALGERGQMPLIDAVLTMKTRLLNLIKVLPVATAVIRLQDGQLVATNDAWQGLFGLRVDTGQRLGEANLWQEPGQWETLVDQLHTNPDHSIRKVMMTLRNSEGSLISCELALTLHDDVAPSMIILVAEDVTLRQEAQRAMTQLAYNDVLTDLPNRVSLHAALTQAHEALQQHGTPYALIMLDLDGFKDINDRFGHDVGDQVLRTLGARFKHAKRPADLVARLGGDEFAVVLHDCSTVHAAEQVALRLMEAARHDMRLSGCAQTLQLGVSAGVSLVTPQDVDALAALKRADLALYRAKADGKHCIRLG